MNVPVAAVPLTVTEVTFVRPSVWERPVSVSAVKVRSVGASGAAVSMVTVKVPVAPVFPATSVATALKTYVPSARAERSDWRGAKARGTPAPVVVPVLSVNGALSLVALTATVEPASAVTATTISSWLVMLSPVVPES